MSTKLIRFKELREKKINLSRSTIWRMERAGTFPKSRRISPNSTAWLESEVDAWIAEVFRQGTRSLNQSPNHKGG